MVLRVLNLAVACWALHISPSLCLAGVLTHPCTPTTSGTIATTCYGDQDHDQPNSDPGSCSHEDNCNSDPCHEGPIVKEGGDQTLAVAPLLPVLPGFNTTGVSLAPLAPWHNSDGPPNRPQLPLHQSDLPLLI